jgi:hypothetical protein
VTCTKTGAKNDLFLHCRRKTKQLSKKELSNVVPASLLERENSQTCVQRPPLGTSKKSGRLKEVPDKTEI